MTLGIQRSTRNSRTMKIKFIDVNEWLFVSYSLKGVVVGLLGGKWKEVETGDV